MRADYREDLEFKLVKIRSIETSNKGSSVYMKSIKALVIIAGPCWLINSTNVASWRFFRKLDASLFV